MKKNTKKALAITAGVLGITYAVMHVIAKKQNQADIYKNNSDEQNPMYQKRVFFVEDENDTMNADGKCGHLEAVGEITHIPTFYEKYIKRGFDIALSFAGMVVLAPIYAGTAIAIKLDDPGEAIFHQKRVAEKNGYFTLIKFRSMSKASDVPTHMLSDSGQSSITRVGKVIRKLSIDELPQLWSIFKGDMSIIGPRPALWNQDWLTAERSKYGANDIKPGLTGLAQISGRDALEIPDKARFDGEYTKALKASSWAGFKMDCEVFFGTIKSVLKSDGVVEGGTKEINKEKSVFKSEDANDTSDIQSFFLNEKDITISIVTYNNIDEIDILMKSFERSFSFKDITVYIIDNASSDGTADYIREHYPWARLLESKKNLGFGRGHNLAIKNVKSTYHIIVNPDIELLEDTISLAIDYMNKNPDIAVLTPFVMNTNGTQQFLPKKNPSMKYMIGGMFDKKFKSCQKIRDEYTLKDQVITNPIDVEFCTGAFMITKTAALRSVGGFDERYFLHFEDADLTRELRKVGRAVYNPEIKVIHKWHRENKKINKSFWVALQSMFLYMKKWRHDNA